MRGPSRNVAVIGTGALSQSCCAALAVRRGVPLRVTVVGRRWSAASAVATLSNARAAAVGSDTTFVATTSDLTANQPRWDGDRPDLVLLMASSQSPWERSQSPSAWTDLVAEGGFGLTLPFQADLAARVAATAAEFEVPYVNACLPDLVNPVLAALGLPVTTGVGNGSTVRAFAAAALNLPAGEVYAAAHHLHLHAPDDPADDAWLLHHGEVLDASTTLAGMRAMPRAELNQVTGVVAAEVVATMLDPALTMRTTLPGVAGRQGGLPVVIADGAITLDLPAEWSGAALADANTTWSRVDGATVIDGLIALSDRPWNALRAHLHDLPKEVPVTDLPALLQRMTPLRDTLRSRPSGASS